MTTRDLATALAVSATAGFFSAPCFAGAEEPSPLALGIYQLHNHPDGMAAPPPYGLRLDELVDVEDDHHDVFTFDFDHELSDMRMELGEDFIDIYGTVFGGLNEGPGYADEWVGLWAVSFSYTSYAFVPGDNDRWTIGPEPADHWGTITALFGDEADFWLQDEAGDHPFSFRLGDEDDDEGFRGFDGISGWGWLNHAPVVHDPPRNGTSGPDETFPHSYDSDWIFTVGDPIPEPGSAALLGLAGLALCRRRR